MNYCPNCGAKISSNNNFCVNCGNQLNITIKDLMDANTYEYLKRDAKIRKSSGRTLVQVTSHGDSCSICKKWEKRILIDDVFSNGKKINNIPLLSEAIKDGLFHKGCRHGLTTYYPELDDINNETDEEYQADLDYINKKNITLILCIFGGWFGLHHFYNKRIGLGILYLFTGGLFGIGYLIDVIKIALSKNKDEKNKRYLKEKEITITSHGYNAPNPYLNAVPYQAFINAYADRKQNKIVKDYVVFDTETTGLEPEIDKIIEISAIKYINNKRVDSFSMLVNPNEELDPFITKLTGITQNDLSNKQTIDKVLPKFFDFIEDYTLVAHNAQFDIKMLACECYRNNIELCKNKIIDTIPLAKKVIPKEKVENYKLETLKQYLGLGYNSHRALDDCETCSTIYQLYLDKNNIN